LEQNEFSKSERGRTTVTLVYFYVLSKGACKMAEQDSKNDLGRGLPERLPITIRGKQKLEEELKRLITVERPSVIRAIEEARAHGDISENAEYDAAKERQALVEGRIAEIQGRLAGAEIVDPSTLGGDRVIFGAFVETIDTETEEVMKVQIVGVDEADVKEGRISILSPIARAMIGKKVGDVVTVRSPKGDRELEITGLKFQ
jgi:transcription elongation factor GreA